MLLVRSSRVVLPDGVRPATIVIEDGRIAAITDAASDGHPASRLLDAGSLVVLPGLVDTHVHVNEPGRAAWEGFASATRAAAAGGITTLVDMPLNAVPPTTSVSGLREKRRAAQGQCHVDVAFWGGAVPGNAGELAGLAAAGVCGFKCFLSPTGVDEFIHVGEADLRAALEELARLRLPLLVHAEDPRFLREAEPGDDPTAYATWLSTRPPDAERAAVDLLIDCARESGVHIHVVHVASARAADAIRQARADGVPVTAETCPHYLSFCAERIPSGATAFKCAPPIREQVHCDALWAALADGTIGLVASDHSPSPAELKHLETGDFLAAWGGVSSLELSLPAVWTAAAARGHGLERIAQLMSASPATLAGLASRKGRIAPGCDADLVFLDPDAEWVVDPALLQHRHPVTPYAGMRLRGRVEKTILRGEIVYASGTFRDPIGQLVERC